MHTAILIDDEPMALEGLSLLIDWAAEGFEIAARFDNAPDALAYLQGNAPDLVVTDLYMPGMDGIAFMQRAREIGYTGHLVIASGHQDFEMAQQALRYGAVGYLLKPVDAEEAGQTLSDVRRLLADHPGGNAHWQARALALAQVQALLARADAPNDRLPTGGAWYLLTLGMPLLPEQLSALSLALAHVGADAYDAVLEGTQYLALHVRNLSAIDRSRAILSLDRALTGRTLLQPDASTNSPGGLHTQALSLKAQLNTLRADGLALLAEMGDALTLLEQERLRSAMRAIIPLSRSHSAAFAQALLSKWWDDCYALFAREPEESQAFLTQVGTETGMREMPLDIGLARISATALGLLRLRDNSLKERMLRYIDAHYAEGISLATMAQALGHSSAYLGRVFRRLMGVSFRPWLNAYRLDVAARRITQEKKPIYQIAEAVGYTKYSYFLEKFTAAYGMMPEAYRKAHSAFHAADIQAGDEILLQKRIDHQNRNG